jgi:hypothetical protein
MVQTVSLMVQTASSAQSMWRGLDWSATPDCPGVGEGVRCLSTRDMADVDYLAGLLRQTAGPMDHCVVTVHCPPTGAIGHCAQPTLPRAHGSGR